MTSVNVSVNLGVEVDTSGNVDVFGYTPASVTNPIYPTISLPVRCLYDATGIGNAGVKNSLIEFWEPSNAVGDITATLSSSDGRDYTKFTKKFARDLQNILEGSFDASGAEPFNAKRPDDSYVYKNEPNYYQPENFGSLVLSAYAHYLLGHVAATAAITNDAQFIRSMLSLDSNDVYKYATISDVPDVSGAVWGDSSATSSDANLALRLIYKLITHNDTTITTIAKQVIGQDASRAAGKDNNEYSPDKRQPLVFIDGDTIYMNIKVKKPTVSYSPDINGNLLNTTNFFQDVTKNEVNYTLCILLSDSNTGVSFPTSVAEISSRQYVTNGDTVNISPFAGFTQVDLSNANYEIASSNVQGYINLSDLSELGLSFNSNTGVISGTLTVLLANSFTVIQAKAPSNSLLAQSTVILNDTGSTVNLGSVSNPTPFYLKDTSTNATGYSSRSVDSITDILLTPNDLGWINTNYIEMLNVIGGQYYFGYNISTKQLTIYGNSPAFVSGGVGKYTIIINAESVDMDLDYVTVARTSYVVEITAATPGAPTLSYPLSSYTFERYATITPISLTVTGDTTQIASYDISGGATSTSFVSGLNINSNNGQISGTIASLINVSGNTKTYSVRAKKSDGSVLASTDITMTINPPVDTSSNPNTITQEINKAISNTVILNKNLISNIDSIIIRNVLGNTSELPLGLGFSIINGTNKQVVLSGTPTELVSQTDYYAYVYSSTNVLLDIVKFSLEVINQPVDMLAGNNYNYVITRNDPNYVIDIPSSAGPIAEATITPNLPVGLSYSILGNSFIRISGTPTVSVSQTAYTITATNDNPDTSTGIITINITILAIAPSLSSYSNTSIDAVYGTAITNATVTNSGDSATFTIDPALPSGLSINSSTGTISGTWSGTEVTTTSTTSYTVTAENDGGSSTATISITTKPRLASITPSTSTRSATVYTAISPITMSNSGGPIASYSISPSLPTGLAFNTSTGTISGTPTVVSASTSYTITATNGNGNATATVSITISPIQSTRNFVNWIDGTGDQNIAAMGVDGAGSTTVFGTVPNSGASNDASGVIVLANGTTTNYTKLANRGTGMYVTGFNNTTSDLVTGGILYDASGNESIADLVTLSDASGTSFPLYSSTLNAASNIRTTVFDRLIGGVFSFRRTIYDPSGVASVLPKSIAVDTSGNSYVLFETTKTIGLQRANVSSTGTLSGATALTLTGSPTNGNYTAGIVKYNSLGNFVNGYWLPLNNSSSSTACSANKMITNKSTPDIIYVVGQSSFNINSGSKTNTDGIISDGFVVALNMSGTPSVSWFKWIGTNEISTNIITASNSSDGSWLSLFYTLANVLARIHNIYTSDGTTKNHPKNLNNGQTTLVPSSIVIDNNNNIYLTGATTHPLISDVDMYFDNTKASANGTNAQFIIKCKNDFTTLWGTYIEGSGIISSSVGTTSGIAVNSSNVYVIGATNNNLSLSGSPPNKPFGSGSDYATYLIKYTV